jgi:hypothetical protein
MRTASIPPRAPRAARRGARAANGRDASAARAVRRTPGGADAGPVLDAAPGRARRISVPRVGAPGGARDEPGGWHHRARGRARD